MYIFLHFPFFLVSSCSKSMTLTVGCVQCFEIKAPLNQWQRSMVTFPLLEIFTPSIRRLCKGSVSLPHLCCNNAYSFFKARFQYIIL